MTRRIPGIQRQQDRERDAARAEGWWRGWWTGLGVGLAGAVGVWAGFVYIIVAR